MNNKYLPSDYQSLGYHRKVVEKLRQEPSLINRVRETIRRWKSQNQNPQSYLDDWLKHIDLGPDHLFSVLLSESDESQCLRSSSPFVGILSEEERMEIWRQYHVPRSTETHSWRRP